MVVFCGSQSQRRIQHSLVSTPLIPYVQPHRMNDLAANNSHTIPHVQKTKGYIFFISSAIAQIRTPFASAYSASKIAVNRLTEYTASGQSQYNISRNLTVESFRRMPTEYPEIKSFALHPGLPKTETALSSGVSGPYYDSVSLSAATMLYLSAGKADWLNGRCVRDTVSLYRVCSADIRVVVCPVGMSPPTGTSKKSRGTGRRKSSSKMGSLAS